MALPTVTRVTQRFLGDRKGNVVHDLYNETKDCDVVAILTAKRAMRFIPDTIERALDDEYEPCPHCFELEMENAAGDGDQAADTSGAQEAAGEKEGT